MKSIYLNFPGEPKAVQSFRFTKLGHKYQPDEVVDWKNYIRILAREQLPESFKMLRDVPLRVNVRFAFMPPKSWTKKKKTALENGGMFFKTTKPDLTDNLMKGLIDALAGIVWEKDQIICGVNTVKYYAAEPGIYLEVNTLKETEV